MPAKHPKKPDASPGFLREVLLDPLQGVADAVTPSPRALREAKKHNLGLLVTTSVVSSLFICVGLYHVYLDPTNPAVWLLVGLWSTPLLLAFYWEFYALRMAKARRVPALCVLGISILWGLIILGLSVEVARQATGIFTIAYWSIILGAFWLLALWGIDYAFEGRLHKLAWRFLRACVSPSRGGG